MLLKIVGIFILSCSVYTALAVIILVISDNKVIIKVHILLKIQASFVMPKVVYDVSVFHASSMFLL